jgi:hypothetical protein
MIFFAVPGPETEKKAGQRPGRTGTRVGGHEERHGTAPGSSRNATRRSVPWWEESALAGTACHLCPRDDADAFELFVVINYADRDFFYFTRQRWKKKRLGFVFSAHNFCQNFLS